MVLIICIIFSFSVLVVQSLLWSHFQSFLLIWMSIECTVFFICSIKCCFVNSSPHSPLWLVSHKHKYLLSLVVTFQVLIFSQMTSILDLLMDYCYLRDFKYSRLDGSMSFSERDENVSVNQVYSPLRVVSLCEVTVLSRSNWWNRCPWWTGQKIKACL